MNEIESLKSQLKEEIKRREALQGFAEKSRLYERQLLSALAALKELQDERDKDKNLPKV